MNISLHTAVNSDKNKECIGENYRHQNIMLDIDLCDTLNKPSWSYFMNWDVRKN